MLITVKDEVTLDDLIDDYLKRELMEVYELGFMWVSEGLKGKFEYDKAKVKFIDSGCGTGKNVCCDQDIILPSIERYEKVLILSDRKSNSLQSKKRIAKLLDCKYILNLSDEEILKRSKFSNIYIKTYQKLENDIYGFKKDKELLDNGKFPKGVADLSDLLDKYDLSEFDCIYFDECQTLMNDDFVYQFANLWEDIVALFPKAKRIYATATPKQIFPILLKKEVALIANSSFNKVKSFNQCYGNRYYSGKEITYYRFERNFDHIKKVKWFRNLDDLKVLFDEIENDSSLTFIDNIEDGLKIKEMLGENAVFISSESIKKDKNVKIAYDFIIENERLPCKHCIATSVILDGINLKNSSSTIPITHIILALHDEDSCIQAIGRVRRTGNKDNVTVYFRHLDKQELWQYIYTLKDKVNTKNLFHAKNWRCMRKINECPERYKGLFYLNNEGKVEINTLAETKLDLTYKLFENLFENYDKEPYKFLDMKCSWINKKIRSKRQSQVSYGANLEAKKEFENFLESFIDISMNNECFESFCVQFKTLYIEAYGKRKSDNSSRNSYGVKIIKEVIEQQKLPYKLDHKGKEYTLHHK